MIKHTLPHQLRKRIQEMSDRYVYVGTNDMSAYDASQRYQISQIENIVIRHFVGPVWATYWDTIGVATIKQKMHRGTVYTPYQMPSGKIMTSFTNTFLNQCMILWAMSIMG